MKSKPKIRRVKAWAVIATYPKRIKNPVDPQIASAKIDGGCGCCCLNSDALGIYLTEQQANSAISEHRWYGMEEEVVPVVITYQLPPLPTKKKKKV